jgi:hypothetical protein
VLRALLGSGQLLAVRLVLVLDGLHPVAQVLELLLGVAARCALSVERTLARVSEVAVAALSALVAAVTVAGSAGSTVTAIAGSAVTAVTVGHQRHAGTTQGREHRRPRRSGETREIEDVCEDARRGRVLRVGHRGRLPFG